MVASMTHRITVRIWTAAARHAVGRPCVYRKL